MRGVSLLDENVVQQHFDEVRLRSGSSPKAQLRDDFHKELTTTLFDFLDLILVHMVIFKSFFHTVQLQLHAFHYVNLEEIRISFPEL